MRPFRLFSSSGLFYGEATPAFIASMSLNSGKVKGNNRAGSSKGSRKQHTHHTHPQQQQQQQDQHQGAVAESSSLSGMQSKDIEKQLSLSPEAESSHQGDGAGSASESSAQDTNDSKPRKMTASERATVILVFFSIVVFPLLITVFMQVCPVGVLGVSILERISRRD